MAMHYRITTLACLIVLLLGPVAAAVPSDPIDDGQGEKDIASTTPPVLLYMKAGTFDPLTDPVPGPSWLLKGSTHPYYILQFDAPPRQAWQDAIEDAGAELLAYLPDYAYFVRIPALAMDEVRTLDHVRYVGPAHGALRVDPDLWYPSMDMADLVIATWDDTFLDRAAWEVIEYGGTVLSSGYDSLIARLPAAIAVSIATDPKMAIAWVEPYFAPELALDNDARTTYARQNYDGQYQMNDLAAWSYNSGTDTFEGWTGKNVTVSVADSGLDDSHPAFTGRIVGYYDYGNDGQADYHGHGTHCSGIVLGDGSWRSSDTGVDGKYSGMAPEASLVIQEVLYGYGSVARWNHDAAVSGATISSNSWGGGAFGAYYDICRSYDDDTRDADSWNQGNQPMLFSFSAGNDGDYGTGVNTISPPATAKNVITVGATGNDKWGVSHNTVASFSSQGPTNDGRLKPDVVIPGHIIASARSTDPYACQGWSRPSDGRTSYVFASGTSMAAPGVAGVAAVVTQYLVEEEGMDDPSPAMLKAAIINGAQPLSGYDYPGFVQGWGSVNVAKTIFENGTYSIFRDDQSVDLEASEGSDEAIYHFMVKSDQPLKVTLVWSDVGGTSASGKHLINDLDLEVFDSEGNRYAGNDFENGETLLSATGYQDRINNIEGFLLNSPKTGIWTIKVKAFNVPQGPQDFALVISGNAEKGHIDLVPTAISATPQGLEEGNTVTLSSTFKNTGNRITDVFDYKVEQVHPDGRVTLVSKANVTDLGGGLQTSRGWSFVGERGYHTLRVTLDPENLVSESNETNNMLELRYFYKGYAVDTGVREPILSSEPGKLVEFNLTVTNRGNVADEFRVTITAAPPGWTAQLIADTFVLEPSETGPVLVSIIAPANATAGEVADIQFTATSLGNTTYSKTVNLRTTVEQVFGIEVGTSVDHLKLYPGDEGEFSILITNPGNGPDRYELVSPVGLDPGWWPAIPEPFIAVDFRSQVSAVLRLSAPDPSPAGSTVRFTLNIKSTGSGLEESISLSAEVLQFYDNRYEVTHREDRAEVGTSIIVGVMTENRGNGPVRYTFDVLAPSSVWNAVFDLPYLDIPGYGWASINLTFSVPDDAISQEYDFTLAAIPDDGEGLSHVFSFDVIQFHVMEISVTSATSTLTQGESVEVKLHLSNLGNGVENAKVLVPDLPGLWTFEQGSSEYEVEPFGELDVVLTFQTSRDSPGGQYEVLILARYGPSPQQTTDARTNVVVRTRPDLRIRQGELNVSEVEPLVGSLVQLSVKVENTGETAARDIYIQFYVNNMPLGQALYSTSIDPGEIQTHTMLWTANVSGLHQISVVIDSTKDVEETNENNNRAEAQVSVQALDLQTTPGFAAPILLAALAGMAILGTLRRRR